MNPSATPTPLRSLLVPPDTLVTIELSRDSLNRLLFPSALISAHTSADAVDVLLEHHTAILTFRTPHPADILFLTQTGQFLLRLVPDDRPSQTVRLRQTKTESTRAASYQTQLADLIEAAYRRETPPGYRLERLGIPFPITDALQWWLAIRYKGRVYTIDEYVVYNAGATSHSINQPAKIAQIFTGNVRALSADPDILQPGVWGRVLVIFPTGAEQSTDSSPHPQGYGG